MKTDLQKIEKNTLALMMRVYCDGHHHPKDNTEICTSCNELLQYSYSRIEACHWGIAKPVCKDCPTHCFNPKYRALIKQVMRYSGPRMLIFHPLHLIRHYMHTFYAYLHSNK